MTKLVRFDWAIKYLLRNKVNFDILEGFLSELLKTSIRIESILESESNQNHENDKFNRVDLLVKTVENKHIIIEVQCYNQWDYLSRILYGASKIVCEHLRQGEAYQKISKVISVSIVFFNLGEGKDYLYRGTTLFKGLHYGDTLALNSKEREVYEASQFVAVQTPENIFPEYYIIKVTQFHEKVQDKIDEWIYFLKHGKIEKTFTAQGIQSAAKKLDLLQLSEEERRIYQAYQEDLHDQGSLNLMFSVVEKKAEAKGVEKGIKQGIEIGIEKGGINERIKIARSLKQAGFSLSEIMMHTGLTEKDLECL